MRALWRRVSVLNAYIPMLSGTGGNSGTQASVAVIRALSLDEVDFSDMPEGAVEGAAGCRCCAVSCLACGQLS